MTRAIAAVAVTALLALGLVPSAAASGLIRVAVVDNVRVVELRGTDVEIVELGACPRCPPGGRRTAAVRASVGPDGVEVDGIRAPGFRLRSELPIRLNGRDYTPPLDVVRSGEGLAVVSELPLEDYLVGVLRSEAGEKWPLEALRAQAVVARTYAAYHRTLAGSRPYHSIITSKRPVAMQKSTVAAPTEAKGMARRGK